MFILDETSTRYRTAALKNMSDVKGALFPDSVVEPFLREARRARIKTPLPDLSGLSGPRFTLDQAKALIQTAFEDFSPSRGAKAREILQSAVFNEDEKELVEGQRWDLRRTPEGESSKVMCSIPAHSADSALGAGNPLSRAVIRFEFDGTLNSVVYMAHEIGHAMADDHIPKPDGYAYETNPPPEHMNETQAYLAQNILYDSLIKRGPKDEIAQAARQHRAATMGLYIGAAADAAKAMEENAPGRDDKLAYLHTRPMSLFTASAVYTHVKDDQGLRAWAADTLLGKYGYKTITQVLADVGIERPAQLATLAAQAFKDYRGNKEFDGQAIKPAPVADFKR